ncbi:pilus assembly protein CpaF [Actinomyces sp. S6-Spd3]|uniref:TadA family conjugal transfer-associated ATPase n=1 Tax=Actinomyces sp. S6-Spd3 TaxID=1284680 RepID=UPI00050DD964|nr:TadA family conjugal transfer-associated ATPase [Actinomyces sp. S6-Spd3]KGF01175.1 pilus assembly protein CpaF [Actinomyces sp. S6-Spd3]
MSVADALLMASTAGEALDEAIMRLKAPGKGIGDVGSALEELDARLNGLGEVLAPLLRLPGITDILVNSTRVWVDCGQGVEPIDDGFSSEEEVRALAITMAAICGKRLDDAVPIVDGILPMGVRVHAVIPPLSGEGTIISLRIPARGGLTLEQMRKGASIDDTTQQILSRMLEVRCNVLISGATGSGKTTLLSALLSSISVNERLICIEEISELHPAHPHVVHLQARQANTQGRGEVSLSELVRAAMRMRPDRIILGECRGGEVRDIMSALNTGHRGSFATIHANTPAEVPARLSALGALAGMSAEATHVQARAAFDLVVHMERSVGSYGNTGRRVAQIGVFGLERGELTCSCAYRIDRRGRGSTGPAWEELRRVLSRDS